MNWKQVGDTNAAIRYKYGQISLCHHRLTNLWSANAYGIYQPAPFQTARGALLALWNQLDRRHGEGHEYAEEGIAATDNWKDDE